MTLAHSSTEILCGKELLRGLDLNQNKVSVRVYQTLKRLKESKVCESFSRNLGYFNEDRTAFLNNPNAPLSHIRLYTYYYVAYKILILFKLLM